MIQAMGIIFGLGPQAVQDASWFNYLTIIVCLTSGTALIMWIGERITDKGIGNGISLADLPQSIVSRFPSLVQTMFSNVGSVP